MTAACFTRRGVSSAPTESVEQSDGDPGVKQRCLGWPTLIGAMMRAISVPANCERTCDSSLVGVPVIVASNNDGCAIGRSAEAKALRVNMGGPVHLIRDPLGVGVLSSS